MPIKPENRHRYPADWPAIRERTLRQAEYRCQHPGCAARQYAVGKWMKFTFGGWVFATWSAPSETHKIARSLADALWKQQGELGVKPIVIVLTIAHLDHQPENCDPANLRAMCQRHHLAHDLEHHQANAHATRRARAGTADLFEEAACR